MVTSLCNPLKWGLAFALVSGAHRFESLHAAAFASAVESYNPGTGYAVEFGSGLGYTLESAVLGQPNPETSFGSVQPFNPPFERAELLSVGTGGHLVVRFDIPIVNYASAWFGLDFIIYGSAGFIDVDYPNGVTDAQAATFGQNTGQTRVSVSQDNQVFFVLDPARAPVVDGLFPTDGSGLLGVPVNPQLGPLDLANKTATEIKALYQGSAGGTGYDLAWALDGSGQSVMLDQVRYVRIDVLSGRSEIDAVAVVPEPATWSVAILGSLLWFVGRCRRNRVN